MLVVVDFGLKPRKIESVGEIFFVYLAEVFIASRGDKLESRGQQGHVLNWLFNGNRIMLCLLRSVTSVVTLSLLPIASVGRPKH